MRYSVRVEDAPFAAIVRAARFIAVDQQSPGSATAWLNKLWVHRRPRNSAQTASHRRHPELLGKPTHKLFFGSYIVYFQIDDDQGIVNIIGFRHGAMRRDR